VSVLIPQSAYSAATLLAFGADEIVIHPNGHLGPVDMQITSFGEGGPRSYSTEDISAFLDFVRENLKITDQEHVRALFEGTCKEVGSIGIGFTARSSKLAVDLGERLLALHMKDDDTRLKLRSIVENMSRKFQSHAYPVNRTEALDTGLPVNKKRDTSLEKLMWLAWLNIEEELKETIPFHPLFELLNSKEAKKLLSPVPQLVVPMPMSTGAHVQVSIDELIKKSTPTIEPIDFELVSAIVESRRTASAHVTRGKILSCRNPNLVIHYSQVAVSQAWEKVRASNRKGRQKR
jgi:Serine dehydrogenase proteinase